MQIWKQGISDVNCEDSKEELGNITLKTLKKINKEELGMFEIHQESPMAGI